ncbi:cytochrome c [Henriciella sp. AS95]|uniref:c-type cytochrome n=1 Tax=Henriciella sp. AS95 TaxID=3135782 RepID=UPI00317D1032
MKQVWMVPLLVVGAFAMTACNAPAEDGDIATPAQTQRAELIGQGETIAQDLCSGCHAVGTEGESPHTDAIPFRQISWKYPVESLAEPLSEGIMVGHPDMPEWQFEPKDSNALIAYIESIQEPQET